MGREDRLERMLQSCACIALAWVAGCIIAAIIYLAATIHLVFILLLPPAFIGVFAITLLWRMSP